MSVNPPLPNSRSLFSFVRMQAQCPACAETGQDRKGEHLRISPDRRSVLGLPDFGTIPIEKSLCRPAVVGENSERAVRDSGHLDERWISPRQSSGPSDAQWIKDEKREEHPSGQVVSGPIVS